MMVQRKICDKTHHTHTAILYPFFSPVCVLAIVVEGYKSGFMVAEKQLIIVQQ